MSLKEIESAAEALPVSEQRELLARLQRRLSEENGEKDAWPVPAPDVPREELRRIHALIEAEFSLRES